MQTINKRKVSFESVKQDKSGKCLICGKDSKIKDSFFNRETKERIICYWDICEECKKVKNCFTCTYSRCWYLRYKGICDVNFDYFLVATFFLEDEKKEISDEDKKAFQTLLTKYGIEVKDKNIKITDFLETIDKDDEINEDDKAFFHALFNKYDTLLYAVRKKDRDSFDNVLKKYDLKDIDLNTSIFDFLDIIKKKMSSNVENSLSDCRMYKTKKIGETIGDFWDHHICKRYKRGDASKEEYDDYNCDFDWDDQYY